VKLLGVSPLPDADGFTRYTNSLPENGRQYIGRLDYVHSDKHSLMFRAFLNDQVNPYHSPPDIIHASRTQGDQESRTATLSHNFVVAANLFAHTQFTVMHLRAERPVTSIRPCAISVSILTPHRMMLKST
jgi:hypothetical protein